MSTDITASIIGAVAQAEQVDPIELDFQLHEHIDVDAVAALAARDDTTWELTFDVPDHDVRVTSDDEVFVDGIRLCPNESNLAEYR
jgi:hypothetical protein